MGLKSGDDHRQGRPSRHPSGKSGASGNHRQAGGPGRQGGRGGKGGGMSSATGPGMAARRAAVIVLRAVLEQPDEAPQVDVLLADATADLDDRDRGLARAIVTASLRRLGSIQHLLAQLMERGYPRKCGPLEAILVTAAAQILFMDTPDHAAVDTAINLARADRNAAPFAGLANAVLRNVVARKDEVDGYDPLDIDTPRWLAARWRAAWGEPQARAIAAALRQEPGVDVSVRGPAGPWTEQLDGVALPLAPAAAATQTIRLRTTRGIEALPGYAEGAWWVQDAAAALPARLLGVQPGEQVADLCAAPGGKTAQLLAAGGKVAAFDRSPARMDRLAANMRRLGFAPERHVVNLATVAPEKIRGGPYDAVLLDAPCSATGTIRRHPDVAWTKRPGDIASLADLQARLLDCAAALLKPGGRLVYSTCSLEPEEGEQQIARFLERNPQMQRLPVIAAELPGLREAINAAGEVRTFPSMLPDAEARMAGLDGFFAARLQRKN